MFNIVSIRDSSMEPFLFKKYDEVIGEAHDLDSLKRELRRLKTENPQAVEYHLREGHIANWLSYIGETGLADRLRGVSDIDVAISIIEGGEKSLETKNEPSLGAQVSNKMRKRRRTQGSKQS